MRHAPAYDYPLSSPIQDPAIALTLGQLDTTSMSADEIQALLRFLTRDAKVPLATAMPKARDLQKANLGTIEEIAESSVETLASIFTDGKQAKSILNAAKRLVKKRAAGDTKIPSPSKRRRASFELDEARLPAVIEHSLELPDSSATEQELFNMVLITNRAPLVVAFAATLLEYTMPEQPPSARLSLAQAVTAIGAQRKAIAIGLDKGKTAEDEGWGVGQPTVKVMGREISIMRRWGYEWKDGPATDENKKTSGEVEEHPALWALDLEQLKHLNGPLAFDANNLSASGLPIYTPESARNYIVKAFASQGEPAQGKQKRSAAVLAAEKETNLGHLHRALQLLFQSWAETLSTTELDARAWSWYVGIRPDVEPGPGGWGAKGQLKLSDILNLRRKA